MFTAVRMQALPILCEILTLLVLLAWNTPYRARACALADELIDLLIG